MPFYFTQKGYKSQIAKMSDLEMKLRELKKGIHSSFEDGGSIHDNANYETLIHEIEIVTKRLIDEQRILSQARVIEYPTHLEKICLGAEVLFTLDGERKKIQIVAYGESDPELGKILYEAPLAKALIGHEPGEKITVRIGDRSRKIEVEAIGPITRS
ncbi:MAG: GreA/GreB family elongation factor [Nanoarchaeota archaeon]|nr:GreA/GreB family elongation factor [Nanoarchaeota archaeon]MBU1321022.1 GreA/GreB family elongation factor [Nanoarchaeota archaeon]MBU1597509.1 GreA/GreB family elongation factor [Nanoarchaeota archaeon]